MPGIFTTQPGDGRDWTDEGPFGWTRDNSDSCRKGVDPSTTAGSFLDKYFWINQQGNQDRPDFTKGNNVLALADPDAFDDFVRESVTTNSMRACRTPRIYLTEGCREHGDDHV